MLVDRRMRYIFHRPDDYVPVLRRQLPYFDSESGMSPTASISGETEDMESNARKRKIESDDEDPVSVKSEIPKSLYSIDEDKTTYGLKQEYLKSLGITPPIEKWVHVSNFRCDKSELKEVLELAGQVLQCSIIYNVRGRYARVMYTHPLEAVQAISMLNGQVFYGLKLQIAMISTISDALVILPKGLTNIGPGLGTHGRPLRDVVKQYKKFQHNINSNIDASLFRNSDYKEEDDGKSENNDVYSIKSSSNPGSFKITNVEDLPDDETVTESRSKKPKRDSENNSVASDHGSEDGKLESTNTSEEPKHINTVASWRDRRINENSNSNTNAGAETQRPPFTPPNVPSPQPISMVYSRPQARPVPPVRAMCPPPPTIGPVSQPGSMGPFAHTVRPLGAPTSNQTMVRPFRNCPPPRTVAMPIPGEGRLPMPAPAHGGAPGPCPPEAHMASSPRLPGSMKGPPFPAPMSLRPNIMPNPHLGPRPMVGNGPQNQPVILEFRNLPPTTTFQLLSEKVSQCGPILSLQLTTPGCAVARFPHRSHAERCFQFFHGKFIDGCVIEARFAS